MAKIIWPDTVLEPVERATSDQTAAVQSRTQGSTRVQAKGSAKGPAKEAPSRRNDDFDVRTVRDEESANALDALARGALAGGRIVVTIAALLIAFVALIALVNGIIGGIGSLFGVGGLTFQKLLGWGLAPLAWLLGVPWSEAVVAGQFIGVKSVLNEFIAYGAFGPQVATLSPVTVVVVTFALAGFANFGSIAIAIGALGSLRAEMRPFVARVGMRALLAATLANFSNAAIAGLVFAR
jgi:CNT family concentrative nucleoside transporter